MDSLYLDLGAQRPFETLLDTTMVGSILDPDAPDGALLSALGIERDGYWRGLFTINASFLNAADESWA